MKGRGWPPYASPGWAAAYAVGLALWAVVWVVVGAPGAAAVLAAGVLAFAGVASLIGAGR